MTDHLPRAGAARDEIDQRPCPRPLPISVVFPRLLVPRNSTRDRIGTVPSVGALSQETEQVGWQWKTTVPAAANASVCSYNLIDASEMFAASRINMARSMGIRFGCPPTWHRGGTRGWADQSFNMYPIWVAWWTTGAYYFSPIKSIE